LIWIVIFNHKAESPTYIIALSGVAIWYFSKEKNVVNLALLFLAFFLTSLAVTDIFPKVLREKIIIPYMVKAVPCIIIWLKITYDLKLNKFDFYKKKASIEFPK